MSTSQRWPRKRPSGLIIVANDRKIARTAQRQRSPNSLCLNLIKRRSIFRITKTTWLWGTSRRSSSRIHSPYSSSLLAWHDGQKPPVRQENIWMTRAWRYKEKKTTTNLAFEPGYSLPFVFRAIVLGLEIIKYRSASPFLSLVYKIYVRKIIFQRILKDRY